MAALGQFLLSEGEAALARGDWAAARSVFADAVEREDTPDAHYGLARALEWAGDFEAAVRCYERAFAGYRARGELRRPAVIAARELSFLHAAVYGNMAAAGGWLARGRSLAGDAGDCPERGWVALAEALASGDPDEIEAHAAVATDVARRFSDLDLLFCAMGYRAEGLVLRGRVIEGMRLVDEAAAAAVSGEIRDHLVAGEIYCKMLLCCELTLDVRRGQEWMAVADSAGRTSHDDWVPAVCGTYYGGILLSAGRWAEAERSLMTSLRLYDAGMRALRSGAAVRLADVRVRQGRPDEAAQLLVGNEFDSAAVLPLARLELLRGQPKVAAAVLRRFLDSQAPSLLHAPALALLAQALVMSGRPDDARDVAARLRPLAVDGGLPHLSALAEFAAGVASRAGGGEDALAHLEAALQSFSRAGLPWEAAHARLEIAHALAGSDVDVAIAEARAALDVFRSLGARADADSAASLLRGLGAPPGPGPRSTGPLTRREQEVLRLVADGRSNKDIAEQLFLSRRTVEHHVGNVLGKLGVSTRTEAVAYVLRHGLP